MEYLSCKIHRLLVKSYGGPAGTKKLFLYLCKLNDGYYYCKFNDGHYYLIFADEKWGSENGKHVVYIFEYFKYIFIDAILEAGGDQMQNVRKRITMAKTRFGKLRYIWHSKYLHRDLKIQLYKACVCSSLTYGSEDWSMITVICGTEDAS